jgi:serine/threonine-protein kinase RsbW
MSDTAQLVITNDTAELERLNQLVEEFGTRNNLHVEENYAIYLCLEELVTNIINYGWPDGGQHEILVRLTVDDQAIRVELEDDGIAFDPTKVPAPDTNKPPQERQIGGLGIHLVRQTVDDMFYQRVDERNILLLKKKRKVAA